MNKDVARQNRSSFILYASISFCIISFSVSLPALNFDMLAYAAAAAHFEISDPVQIHEFVYRELAAFVGDARMRTYTDNGMPIRQALVDDPNRFYDLLRFYEMRIGYTSLIYALWKLGVNIYQATYLISSVSAAVGVMALYYAYRDRLTYPALCILAVFIVGFGVFSLSRTSSPDALVFMVVALMLLALEKRRLWFLVILAPALVLVRSDLVLFSTILPICCLWVDREVKAAHLATIGASIAAYFATNTYFDNYGWSAVFLFTFIDGENIIDHANSSVSYKEYMAVMAIGILNILDQPRFIIYSGVCLLAKLLSNIAKDKIENSRNIHLYIGGSAAYVAAHFILFPVIWDRFFVSFYIMGAIALMFVISDMSRAPRDAKA